MGEFEYRSPLAGKVALVTGSGSGIGLAIAKALAVAGAHLVINGREPESELRSIADELCENFGTNAIALREDVGDPQAVKTMVAKIEDQLGPVSILVNNAGIQRVHPAESFPIEDWQAIININLSAAFYTIQSTLPMMRKEGWGRIINIASVHGLVASVHKAAYVASKHGLVGLTKVIALETAEENITCNAICPGWTRTPLIEPQIEARGKKIMAKSDEEAVRSLVGEKQPSGQFVRPEDLAALTLFLCSDAARQMTGVSLPIDGGWTAQ